MGRREGREQAPLEPRPPGDRSSDPAEVVLDAEQGLVPLYPASPVVRQPATLPNMLGPGSYYDWRYSVDLPAASMSPGADGLIRHGNERYIRLGSREGFDGFKSYRVEVNREGAVHIVHPLQPYSYPRIPVR